MPYYKPLSYKSEENNRIINKIKILRSSLKINVPKKTHSENLLLATWNIRDFDKPNWGDRLKESKYYIAEIISHFDIVCIQEVYRDLSGLNDVMKILGSDWDCIFTDATEGRRGNDERMAMVFDKTKVAFSGLAGELVVPPIREKINGKFKTHPIGQVWRTPMLAGFRAGWAKFILCSVHIQWGESTAESVERKKEIEHVAKFLKYRSEDKTSWARKIILLGDFNIFDTKDNTYKTLEENGYRYPDALASVYRKNHGTNNAKKKRHYDQILFRERENGFEVINGGVFDPFQSVFLDNEEDIYKPFMIKPKKDEKEKDQYYKSYKTWRTYQISDHNPLWVEFKIDYSDDYLEFLSAKQ